MNESPSAIQARSQARGEGASSELISARLRQNAERDRSALESRLPSFALEHAVRGDLGHLHATHDLRTLPIGSHRRLLGKLTTRGKRALVRGLHPIPEAQSVWNGANARVITFLLRQLAAQGRAIESLERQVANLHDELRR